MKNLIIAVLLLATLSVGYVAATAKLRMSLTGLEGKSEKLSRGDLTIPINATGEVKPSRRVEIKSEASGEVIEIAKRAGDRVRVGDLLIRLQRDDEQRSVDRARQELEIAAARLEEARLALLQARTIDTERARADIGQYTANVELARFRKQKIEDLPEHQRNAEEVLQRQTTLQTQVAQLDIARLAYDHIVNIAIPTAEQKVAQATANYETSKTTLGDAEKRLSKTDVVSPIEGVLADIRTQIGEVIQGGKTTLTGGTVLAVVLDADTPIVRTEVDESDIGRVLKIAPPWATPGRPEDVKVPRDFRAAAADLEHLPAVTVDAFRDEEFAGVVERIYPEPKNLSGVVTYLVDVVIISDNRGKLLPGMRADVRFTSEHAENVVLCPNEAIREGPGGDLGVHIPKPGGSPDERPTQFVACRFGLDNGNYSEVLDGLQEGAVVYTVLPERSQREERRDRRR